MAQKLQDGDHGKATVVQLLVLGFLQLLGSLAFALGVTKDQITTVVHSADEKENLSPAKSWDGRNCGHSIGNGLEGHSRSNEAGEFVDFRHNVAENSQLSNATVLQLSLSVACEGLIIFGKACM